MTRPLGRRRLRRLGRSAPATLELTVQQEPFYQIVDLLPPLFTRHWRELALDQDVVPLAPNWDQYLAYAAQNVLHVTTVRCGEALVGYIFNLVAPHLHYKTTLHATIDIFWLDPAYRGNAWVVLRWFRANEAFLREGGVKRIIVSEKLHFMGGRVGLIFKRLGYTATDVVHTKVL